MSNDPLARRVAAELELLSGEGEELATTSDRATINLYTREELALRATEFGIAYLERQSGISTDGLAAVVTAGPPAAGKSTILETEGFHNSNWRDLDADLVKEHILKRALADHIFDDLLAKRLADGDPVRPMELATLVHRESTAVLHNVMQVCLRRGENLLVQGTLAWEEQPYILLESLAGNGYGDLTIVDVEVDVTTALDRAVARWWRKRHDERSELGGRFMPSSLIRDMYLAEGGTKCGANAQFMFEISELPAARLITSTTLATGEETRRTRFKLETEEVTPEVRPADAPHP